MKSDFLESVSGVSFIAINNYCKMNSFRYAFVAEKNSIPLVSCY